MEGLSGFPLNWTTRLMKRREAASVNIEVVCSTGLHWKEDSLRRNSFSRNTATTIRAKSHGRSMGGPMNGMSI